MKRATVISKGEGNSIGAETRSFEQELYKRFEDKIPKEFKKYARIEYILQLPLYADSEELSEALSMAEENNYNVKLFSHVYYTKAELEKCDFFQLSLMAAPLELEGTDAATYGTQYEGGCLICGNGIKRIGDILVDRKFVNKVKADIGTLKPDPYVSEKLRDIIISNGFTGVSFEDEVKDYKGREMPRKLYAMNVHNVLPPLSDTTWLVPSAFPCKKCGDDSTLYLRSDLQYEREKLDGANDFNLTCEYIDNWHEQYLVVSARVRKVFKENKMYCRFIPVCLL